jgi:hypothetical protein
VDDWAAIRVPGIPVHSSQREKVVLMFLQIVDLGKILCTLCWASVEKFPRCYVYCSISFNSYGHMGYDFAYELDLSEPSPFW